MRNIVDMTFKTGEISSGMLVRGSTIGSRAVAEGHRNEPPRTASGLRYALNSSRGSINLDSFPAAAACYDVSPNLKDHVIVELAPIILDVPNRNGDCFAKEDCLEYSHLLGRQYYQTFVGKPSCADHPYDGTRPMDPKLAKGVILDAVLRKSPAPTTASYDKFRRARGMGKREVWEIFVVQSFCRQKDKKLANEILSGKRKYYSMACIVPAAACSICGKVSRNNVTCEHINAGRGKGRLTESGLLIYEKCKHFNMVECSSVIDPANPRAEGKVL